MRFSRALTYRVITMVGAAALAALAFSRGSRGWSVVGGVLAGAAIADLILLVAVARFHWNRRRGGSGADRR